MLLTMFNVEIIPAEKLDSIIPLLKILNPEISFEVIEKRLHEIRISNYQCVGVYSDNQLIAISGLWILNKIYAGKHIEPDNVVVHPDFRNKGVGELMMNRIHEYAIKQGCLTSELNARIVNEDGARFWKKQGYEVVGYHFIKKLHSGDDKNSFNSCLSKRESESKNH